MKIVDCFIFYNELDMLKFRLEYLYDTVDHFVLVEMYKTHSGNLKPYYFNENKKLFEKYLDKIVHVMVDDDYIPMIEPKNKLKFGLKKKEYKPPRPNIQREIHHRNCIRRGIDKLKLSDSDIIIISDLDEIPDRNTLKEVEIDGIYSLNQDMYYYNLTCKVQEKWTQSRIMQFLNIKHSTSIQLLRVYQFPALNKPGGWHFSYFGNIEFIKNKLKNFCHAGEDRIEIITEKDISDALKSNSDLFGRSNFMTVPIEENTYLPENYGMLKF